MTRKKKTDDQVHQDAQEQKPQAQNNNPFNAVNEMYAQFMKDQKMPQMDKSAMFATHRKNLESLNEANKMAADVMKSIATLQGQFIRQAFDDMTSFMRDAMTQKLTPEVQGEKIKGAVAKAMEHSSNIANIMLKSNQDIFKSMQNKFKEGMEDLQETTKSMGSKKPTKH
jgi:phasin family protein